jgi:hypothetical protein
MSQKRCTQTACQGTPLVKSSMESSLSVERWDCPRCTKSYSCPTPLASGAQVASAASACAIVATFFFHAATMDWEGAIDHAAEHLG